jgi:N-methylhydantoinase A/oxoprolinase/acetone carboxylase beta subunit
MIVGSGQLSDGYGNSREHRYSPDGVARIGVQAGHPNFVACDIGGTSFDVSLIATGGPALGEGHRLWRAVARAARFYSLNCAARHLTAAGTPSAATISRNLVPNSVLVE